MKSFKQFIREQEELEEKNFGKMLAGLALAGGLVSGMQAGAMRHDPIANVGTTSKQVETSGKETRTTELTRTGAMKAGEQARHMHRGFFDLKNREVVDTLSSNIPSKSSMKVTKTGPDGTSTASRKVVGGKTVERTGNIDKTKLKVPSGNITVSGSTDSFKQR